MFRTIKTHNTQNIEFYLIFLRIHKLKQIMDTQLLSNFDLISYIGKELYFSMNILRLITFLRRFTNIK